MKFIITNADSNVPVTNYVDDYKEILRYYYNDNAEIVLCEFEDLDSAIESIDYDKFVIRDKEHRRNIDKLLSNPDADKTGNDYVEHRIQVYDYYIE